MATAKAAAPIHKIRSKIRIFFSVSSLISITGVFYTLHSTPSWNISIVSIPLYLIVAYFFTKYWIELPYKGYYSGSAIPILLACVHIGLWFGGVLCFFTSLCSYLIYRHSLKTEALNFLQYWISLLVTSFFLNWGIASGQGSVWLQALVLVISTILFEITAFVIVTFYDWANSSKPLQWAEVKEYAKDGLVPVLISICLIPWPYINLHYDPVYYWITLPSVIALFLFFRSLVNAFNHMRMKTNSLVESFGEMIDQKTNRTRHAIQVGKISVLIGERLGLAPKELDVLFQAATLHDIGKTVLLDHLWTRRGKFTLEEEKEYRTHVQKGADLIRSIKGLESMGTIILHQHEHYDGTGFPNGLSGEEIPLYSRIIRIASRIDRLQTTSPTLDLAEALATLSGNELDPKLVALCNTIDVGSLYSDTQPPPPVETYDFISEIKKELYYTSELTKHISDLQIVLYSHHSFQFIDGGALPFAFEAIKDCIEETTLSRKIKRDIVRLPNDQVYGVTCVPLDNIVLIIILKLSEILQYEQSQKQLLSNIYKDVLYSATQGKLEIVEREEYQQRFFDFSLPVLLRTKEDIPLARQPFMEFLNSLPLAKEKKMKYLLCVNEALTNVVKHAEIGHCGFRKQGNLLEYSISDNGNGINLECLPKSSLLKGFSTQHSMGHGFKLMIEYCDHIFLCTGNQGTSLVMQFVLPEEQDREV